MAPATDVTGRGALCTEAALLRSRVLVIRGLVRTLPDLAEASVVDAVMRLRPFVNHLAARARAEEHATAIAAWTPAMGRPKLALLLTAFCETAEAHLDLEADRCLSVVHEHTSARTERYLFGEIEI